MNIAQELRRPADEIEKQDPYAELKAAHAAGKVIQLVDLDGDWFDLCQPDWSCGAHEYRIKPEEPWTLPRQLPGFRALRDGEEWHFADKWEQEWLPAGTRPLLVGEPQKKDDEFVFLDGQIGLVTGYTATKPDDMQLPRRTKRPLPILTASQITEGWIEWHGGENPVPGERVVIMCRDFEIPEWQIKGAESKLVHWSHIKSDDDIIAYRVIEPKLIPLGPEDVRCGDELKRRDGGSIYGISAVHNGGVDINTGFKQWDYLREFYLIRRHHSATFIPCSKEAAE